MSDLAARSLTFTYTNWRGEVATRWATPLSFRWCSTEWHPEPQWLMRAFDHDKGEEREFALVDCVFRKPEEPQVADMRAEVSRLTAELAASREREARLREVLGTIVEKDQRWGRAWVPDEAYRLFDGPLAQIARTALQGETK